MLKKTFYIFVWTLIIAWGTVIKGGYKTLHDTNFASLPRKDCLSNSFTFNCYNIVCWKFLPKPTEELVDILMCVAFH
jgi:hypothetical protein